MVVQQRRDYCSQQRRSLVTHWRCDNHYALGKRKCYSRLHHSQPDIAQFGIDIRSNVFDSKKTGRRYYMSATGKNRRNEQKGTFGAIRAIFHFDSRTDCTHISSAFQDADPITSFHGNPFRNQFALDLYRSTVLPKKGDGRKRQIPDGKSHPPSGWRHTLVLLRHIVGSRCLTIHRNAKHIL